MVSLETIHATTKSIDQTSSPRISFSSEFLDESNFISITPNPIEKYDDKGKEKARNNEFEFLSSEINTQANMLTADELFFEGKLLPFWQVQLTEKLNQMSLKSKEEVGLKEEDNGSVKTKEEPRVISWFIDDDPSPRPPKCTVLWKELLRLKKQRASSLSPSSSSSSTSSSSSSMGDIVTNEGKEGSRKCVKKVKKGMERSRSASFRIRPMVNVPICKQVKGSAIPSVFPLKKGRLER